MNSTSQLLSKIRKDLTRLAESGGKTQRELEDQYGKNWQDAFEKLEAPSSSTSGLFILQYRNTKGQVSDIPVDPATYQKTRAGDYFSIKSLRGKRRHLGMAWSRVINSGELRRVISSLNLPVWQTQFMNWRHPRSQQQVAKKQAIQSATAAAAAAPPMLGVTRFVYAGFNGIVNIDLITNTISKNSMFTRGQGYPSKKTLRLNNSKIQKIITPSSGEANSSNTPSSSAKSKCPPDQHDWVDTGMKKTWCKKCDTSGEVTPTGTKEAHNTINLIKNARRQVRACLSLMVRSTKKRKSGRGRP